MVHGGNMRSVKQLQQAIDTHTEQVRDLVMSSEGKAYTRDITFSKPVLMWFPDFCEAVYVKSIKCIYRSQRPSFITFVFFLSSYAPGHDNRVFGGELKPPVLLADEISKQVITNLQVC
jgi:hypothetical protein